MNIEEIKTIVKLMADYDLTEFQVESESATLSIKRGLNGVAMPAIAIPAAAPVAAPVPAAAPAPAAAAESNAPKITIDSPIVGTFYRAPAPDAPEFVKIGDHVDANTVVGIIEAMKVMNEIKAEKSGVVKEIVAQNGQPVEYGQVLIVLE